MEVIIIIIMGISKFAREWMSILLRGDDEDDDDHHELLIYMLISERMIRVHLHVT